MGTSRKHAMQKMPGLGLWDGIGARGCLPARVIATSGDGGFHVSETEILKKGGRGVEDDY